jgi:hypothetical protein
MFCKPLVYHFGFGDYNSVCCCFPNFNKNLCVGFVFIFWLTIPDFIFSLWVGGSVYVQKISLANWFWLDKLNFNLSCWISSLVGCRLGVPYIHII